MYLLSGPPADGTILHVVFYPDPRLTAHSYKKFSAGSPADGSQRVNNNNNNLFVIHTKIIIFRVLIERNILLASNVGKLLSFNGNREDVFNNSLYFDVLLICRLWYLTSVQCRVCVMPHLYLIPWYPEWAVCLLPMALIWNHLFVYRRLSVLPASWQ